MPVNISLVDLKVDDAMPRLVCGIVTDLTFSRMRTRELGAANERLASEIVERRKTEENLQLTLDAAEMGIWELDLARRPDEMLGTARPDIRRRDTSAVLRPGNAGGSFRAGRPSQGRRSIRPAPGKRQRRIRAADPQGQTTSSALGQREGPDLLRRPASRFASPA